MVSFGRSPRAELSCARMVSNSVTSHSLDIGEMRMACFEAAMFSAIRRRSADDLDQLRPGVCAPRGGDRNDHRRERHRGRNGGYARRQPGGSGDRSMPSSCALAPALPGWRGHGSRVSLSGCLGCWRSNVGFGLRASARLGAAGTYPFVEASDWIIGKLRPAFDHRQH